MKKKNDIIAIITGMAILAFGMFNIHSRCMISEGGVLGLTLLVYHWFGITPAITGFLCDSILFLTGTFFFGGSFLGKSLIATSCFSLWYSLFDYIGPVVPNLSDRPLIAAVLGGILVGTGVGMVVKRGVAAGGDDAMVLIFNKLFGFKYAAVYFVSDAVVLLLSLSYIPFHQIFYSLISVMISSLVIQIQQEVSCSTER